MFVYERRLAEDMSEKKNAHVCIGNTFCSYNLRKQFRYLVKHMQEFHLILFSQTYERLLLLKAFIPTPRRSTTILSSIANQLLYFLTLSDR